MGRVGGGGGGGGSQNGTHSRFEVEITDCMNIFGKVTNQMLIDGWIRQMDGSHKWMDHTD